ncbi:MAG: carbohydrate-binding family 9-like protein [Myxococcales bacterium]|nr:carbohydrate-binding family 9-like protein [Myxococcales bacterium]MDH3484595.1 carbohydrate-binding family 9-like protein [Myxococcales bacterium]
MGFPCRLLVLALASAMGCTTDSAPLSPAQREAVAAYVSKTAPTPAYDLDVEFGKKVRLLGYDLDATEWRPGETLRVTWYWQAQVAPGAGWKLFTHLVSDDPPRRVDGDVSGVLRWLYGPDRWQAGEFVEDTQELHLPEDWKADEVTLYVGLSRQGERLPITAGQSDGDERARGPTVKTPVGAKPGTPLRVPRLAVAQTRRPPRLDGSLNDPVWSAARRSAPFVETRTGDVAPLSASAKLLWDKRYLYVGVDVSDALLRASDRDHDDHLWEQDCVELMIDPNGDGKSYFEIQVSPRGVVFDTRYDARRVPKPFGHVDWDSEVRAAVSPLGKLDDLEPDAGYTVEMAIPWQAFSRKNRPASPPRIGDNWRANLYVIDLTGDRQQAAAWSPPGIGDFHVPGRFGILTFEGPPDEMVGQSEPVQMPSNRVKQSQSREDARDTGVKGQLIKRRVMNRRHPGEPRAAPLDEGSQRLESKETAH